MAQTPKRGLGKGFSALISDDFDQSLLLTPEDRVEKIPLKQLRPNPQQPRQHFDQTALKELAASIKRHGIVQPLIVSPGGQNTFNIVAGERRWRAAGLAGLESVPAIVRKRQELEQLEVALIENVQRVDLSPLEQAISIERLHEQFSFSYESIAERLGKATSTVHNIVRLLKLPEAARDALAAGLISEGHARAILALKDDAKRQAYLLEAIQTQHWSVRQAERFVLSVKAGTKETKKVHEHVATETPLTRRMAKRLGTPVHIRRTAKGGKLEIDFRDDHELDRIASLLD